MILPIRCCCDPWLVLGTIDNVPGLAIKSEDVPLERLRKMKGFVEINKRLDVDMEPAPVCDFWPSS